MKHFARRVAGLILTVAITLSVSGWIPFTAPVTIHSYPSEAPVYIAGTDEQVGTTPFETLVFATDQHYEIRLDKFHPQPVTVGHSTKENLYFKLNTEPVLVYTKPSAELFDADTGEKVGDTPMDVTVFMKDRNYIIKKQDYFSQNITVGLNSDTPMVIELQHRPLITIRCEQDDVDIYENGSFVCKAPLIGEISTTRTFELRKDTFYSKRLTLTPAQTHELNYQTSVSLKPYPTIQITTEPSDAYIYKAGSSYALGQGSVTLQMAEDTDFIVKATRYYDEPFTLKASGDQKAMVSLDAMPYATLSSSPPGATVVIAGKEVGTTPTEWLAEEPVSATFQLDGYIPQTITVSKSDLTPTVTLEEVPPPPPPPPPEPETNIAPVVVEAPVPEPVAEEKQPGLSPAVIGGIAVGIIALIGIIATIAKKKK